MVDGVPPEVPWCMGSKETVEEGSGDCVWDLGFLPWLVLKQLWVDKWLPENCICVGVSLVHVQ